MRRSLLLFALTLVVSIGSTSAPAWADHQGEPTGQFAVLEFESVGEPDREVGAVVQQDYVSRSVFTEGPTTGINEATLQCLTVRSKRLVCHGTGMFTGTIAGVGTGTTTNRQHFTCRLPDNPFVEPTVCKGNFRTVSGTGGLAGYRDVGKYESVPGSFVLYSYTAHETSNRR
jgi:hypothetical protein